MTSIAYAANRPIGLSCLKLLMDTGIMPKVLLLPEESVAECAIEMEELATGVPVLRGKTLGGKEGLKLLKSLDLDYVISVHFPHIFPKELLELPLIGVLNLHPAYLPWNRGWHTPSWAILDGTPFGGTLHWVDGGMDTGDIALQKKVEILETDTAHTLYQRALASEIDIFRDAIPMLLKNELPKVPQKKAGSSHKKTDLASIQCLNNHEDKSILEVVKIIRALTTSKPEEAAYFEKNGKTYSIRAEIAER